MKTRAKAAKLTIDIAADASRTHGTVPKPLRTRASTTGIPTTEIPTAANQMSNVAVLTNSRVTTSR